MISLHSCFVAGLTLVYSIWRDSSLFSYEVVEATQSCLQILTIFGEKWPGAVKYRDIFDAMSQSLFKLAMRPRDNGTRATKLQPLHLHNGTQHHIPNQPLEELSTSDTLPSLASQQAGSPTMSRLVTEAVKDAFMEIDEEAPGGWQGWRMWNEMVASDNNSNSRPEDVQGGNVQLPENDWSANQGSVMYAIDPFQDPIIQSSNFGFANQNQWSLSGYR